MKGFTLIEIVVALSIFFIIAGITAPLLYDSYRRTVFLTEKEDLISLLQQARQRAIDNMDGLKQGVHVSTDEAILFEGDTYDERSIKISGVKLSPFIKIIKVENIIFDQLSGEAPTNTIVTLLDNSMNSKIEIEKSGRINY